MPITTRAQELFDTLATTGAVTPDMSSADEWTQFISATLLGSSSRAPREAYATVHQFEGAWRAWLARGAKIATNRRESARHAASRQAPRQAASAELDKRF